MLFENINWITILLAAIVNMIVGSFWYSPVGFGKIWMKLSKVEMGGGNLGVMYGITFVSSLVQAFVLSRVIMLAGSTTILSGMKIGLLMGVGFIATSYLNQVIFGNKPVKLFYLDVGYYLVVLVLNGALIATLG